MKRTATKNVLGGLLVATATFILGTTVGSVWMSKLSNSIACDMRQASTHAVKEPQASPSVPPQPSASAEAVEEDIQISDFFTDGEELLYNGYVVRKRYRKARLDYPAEPTVEHSWVEISYAVLERDGSGLARFDKDIYFGMGNDTNFGLFSFLGGDAKQLIVSQDIRRGGNQWIASLSPRFHIIHDGAEYNVGREAGDIGVVDLDHDGVYEITQLITAFYGFSEWIPTGNTPLPTVIFKYNAKAQKYLPANTQFRDYLLRDIDEAKQRVSGAENQINHLTDVLPIVLDYVFSGEEQTAWAFYEETYGLPDKVELKRKIKAVLEAHPVYRFMYRRSGKR